MAGEEEGVGVNHESKKRPHHRFWPGPPLAARPLVCGRVAGGVISPTS